MSSKLPIQPSSEPLPFFSLQKDTEIKSKASPFFAGKRLEDLAKKKRYPSFLNKLFNLFGQNVFIRLESTDKTGFYISTETAKEIIALAAKKITPSPSTQKTTISTKKIGRLFAAAMSILTKEPSADRTAESYLRKSVGLDSLTSPAPKATPAQTPAAPPLASTPAPAQTPAASYQAATPLPSANPPQILRQKYPQLNWTILAEKIEGQDYFICTSSSETPQIHVYDQNGSLDVKKSLKKKLSSFTLTYQGFGNDSGSISFAQCSFVTGIPCHDLASAVPILQPDKYDLEKIDPIYLAYMFRIDFLQKSKF